MSPPGGRARVRLCSIVAWSLVGAAVAAGCGGVGPASAYAPQRSLTLSPAIAEGTARPGASAGPFALFNWTERRYYLRTSPVLLGQNRDGGLFVRLDRASRERAAALLDATRTRAPLPPGASASAAARVRRVPARHSIYGGVLFEALPRLRRGGRRPQIVAVLRLNARVLLDPPQPLRRIRLSVGAVRAEQAGERRLALRLPVENRGNVFVAVGGRLAVRDASGTAVARPRLRPIRVLPGATVELAAPVEARLPAGDYRVTASVHADGRREAAPASPLRLVGVNEVVSREAELTEFSPPPAYFGERAEVEATFRNTGNVRFAPRAEIELRGAPASGAAGRRYETATATVEPAAPARTGKLRASVAAPRHSGPLELTARLLDGGRELDRRTVSVTPAEPPPILSRAGAFIAGHAVALLGSTLAALLATLLIGGRRLRQLRRELGERGGTRSRT